MTRIDDAPPELSEWIKEFWPSTEWDNAASISLLESGWSAFAVADTRDASHPCGSVLHVRPDGITVTAEYSIGWFQINACTLPLDWTAENLYNTRHNCGTAHALWTERGWQPWYFSAKALGLL
jgi:hypothetical protein